MNHVGWLHGTDTSRAQACPDLSRKHIQRRQTHLERQNRIWTKTGRSHAAIGRRHRACNRRSRLEARRHNGPCLTAGLNVPLGGQQGISGLDSASCQAQFLGQRACRGYSVTRLQHAAGNGAAKPVVDLSVKRGGRFWIQRRDIADLRDGHGMTHSDSCVRRCLEVQASMQTRSKLACITWTSCNSHSWPLDGGHEVSKS